MDEHQRNQRKQIGDRIKAARTERGWSQARLAAASGVSENTVLSIEKAERTTQPGKLRPVLDALGLAAPADDMLDLDGVPEDVRILVKVIVQRMKLLTPERRAIVAADIYPRLLAD